MPRRPLALVCTVLALSACSGTVVPLVKPAAGPSLEQSDAAFFANRYTEAEADYKKFIDQNSGSALGHAHYALFLNYVHRYEEAVAQVSTALKQDSKDAYVRAIATRVNDWWAPSTPNPGATFKVSVAQGARAVALGPKLPLAHIFYSEVLADTGKTTEAQHQMDQAAALTLSTYDRAELERERANLAGDANDAANQLKHLQAARDIQSGWAERTREVAEYYFSHDQLDQATTEFRKAIDMAPKESDLRVSLGNVALLRADVQLADEAFRGANDVKPHDPLIESTLAVTTYDLKRDTAATEKLLRDAASDAPDAPGVAELLQGFLRYIKGDQAAASAVSLSNGVGDSRAGKPRTDISIDSLRALQSAAALAAVNKVRETAGLPDARVDPQISEGAISHAYWWIFNLALPEVKGLGIHHEVSGTPGFTGVTMRDRATHFGFHQASMSEDITHHGTPEGAVADWVDSVFHRFPILRADLDAIGYGMGIVSIVPVEVMDMSYRDQVGDVRLATAYPAPDQTDVPPVFTGNELPDPVPVGGHYPTGYPVTVNFSPFATVHVSDARVLDPSGTNLQLYLIQPTPAGSENVLSMLPVDPLKNGNTYHVHVSGTINGAPFSKDWSFTTQGAVGAGTVA